MFYDSVRPQVFSENVSMQAMQVTEAPIVAVGATHASPVGLCAIHGCVGLCGVA